MDRKYIDDHHVVARYLADQLPDAQREAFEAYYLEHPEVVQEMEAAARFKVGLLQLKESGELGALISPMPWFRQQRYLAIAASIAIIAIGLLLWINRSPSAQPLVVASSIALTNRLGQPLPIASTHAVLRTRSISYDAEIELPETPQTIALRVLPEVEAQPARYRITISSIADDDTVREVAALGGLVPAEDGFVPVYLNSSKLVSGRYQLVLSGDPGTNAADEASAFLIKISDNPS